ncbi:MAG: AAA family ATPase, partial [Phycisphaera sp. RhM]|nr:AAA family ATPase [Phycisphaera sp. RhM]
MMTLKDSIGSPRDRVNGFATRTVTLQQTGTQGVSLEAFPSNGGTIVCGTEMGRNVCCQIVDLRDIEQVERVASAIRDDLSNTHGITRDEIATEIFKLRNETEEATVDKLLEATGLEEIWSSARLDSELISNDYLIDRVLVANQPAVVAGAFKTWKTSLAIEMAVSLASEKTFLGEFEVPSQKRVLVFSAESGKATIQATARRVCESKRVSLGSLSVDWGWWVPKASNDIQLDLLSRLINKHRSDVVIIDPLYLSLTGEIQSNLALTGEQLNRLTQQCLEASATPVLVDHVKRSSENARACPLSANMSETTLSFSKLRARRVYMTENADKKISKNPEVVEKAA